jgi:hypothetical protein
MQTLFSKLLRSFVLVALVLATSQVIFAQSDILRRGQSGIGAGLGFSTNRETGQYLVTAGYAYQGFLDGTLMYSKASRGEVTQGVITPTVTFYPVKQEDADKVPTLGISLGFSHYVKTTTETVYSPNPDTTIIGAISFPIVQETTINALKFGVTAARRLGYWSVWFLQPSIGGRISISSAPWEFMVRADVTIGTRIVGGPIIALTPALEIQSGATTFALLLRTMF